MENIRQAVERARAAKNPPGAQVSDNLGLSQQRMDSGAHAPPEPGFKTNETEANVAYLRSKRIVAFDGADQRSRAYDMLRTQLLQSMDVGGWRIIGVTSPTPGCGKTLTAINLAFSAARQPDQSVVLIDFDLQKPQIANYLGLTPKDGGALALLQGRAALATAMIPFRAGNQRIMVLPTTATRHSSELMSSRAMRDLLQDFRRNYRSHLVVLDLPPILCSDDVIAALPQIDCVLLVTAVGHSKASEVEECSRHLQSSHLVRVVVNKATDEQSSYFYYY